MDTSKHRRFASVIAIVAGLAAAAVSQQAAASERLYENIEVRGVLECAVKRDIRTMVGGRRVRCEFEPAGGLPDVVKGYFGSVRALDEGDPAADGNVLLWNILYLKNMNEAASDDSPMTGAYSPACLSVQDEYGLKDGSLIGGAMRNIALEPRDVDQDSAQRNIASAILMFEISK